MKPSHARKFVRPPQEPDTLLPVLSLMLILIPVLIGKMTFSQLRITEVEVPDRTGAAALNPETRPPAGDAVVVAYLSLGLAEHLTEAVEEKTGERLSRLRLFTGDGAPALIRTELRRLQKRYRTLDTVLVTAAPSLPYEKVIAILAALQGDLSEPGMNLRPLRVVLLPSGGV